MAKNTGIERSKKNPIEFEHWTSSFITCIEHRYAVVLLGFSDHDATFSSMWSRDLFWLIPNIYFFQFE
jgi:hypothetical protein